MHIEVAAPQDAPAKDKGDLLEQLLADLLKRQSYEVKTQVRVTATEFDALCRHKVSGRTLYAECKAYRDTLGVNALHNLLGKLAFQGVDEGWLVCTGTLGKDAKGFQEEWEQRDAATRQRLSIYTPDRILTSLIDSGLCVACPTTQAAVAVPDLDEHGAWVFLVTPYGRYYALTKLEAGLPASVVVFSSKTGEVVLDPQLLTNLARTDTSLASLAFDVPTRERRQSKDTLGTTKVAEVQSGEHWSDYRPARPEDFVGRSDAQDKLIELLRAVAKGQTGCRLFAVTGDSGVGKSSLIAKVRERSRNVRNKNNLYVYAVDMRAASDRAYVFSALLAGLYSARDDGFGARSDAPLRVSDFTNPLRSESVHAMLSRVRDQSQTICIVFDQFEELFSKPELFPVFEEMQKLLLSVISSGLPLVLGFAWKTDSTIPQNHPAYYLWQRFADHRMEIPLRPFTHSEATTAVTLFEKELGEGVQPELRRQLIESSQGFPWLLKKLCIHVYEQLRRGARQEELSESALDASSLFDQDLQKLNQAEAGCLTAIARDAPADWFEILEIYGQDVVTALQENRLVVRSGDRINIYWDIFREYVLTKTIPAIPFTYLPSSPSIRTLLNVATRLTHEDARSPRELSDDLGVSEKTVGNVMHDLRMFGVATGPATEVRLDQRIESASADLILHRLRNVLRRHSLTRYLDAQYEFGAELTTLEIVEALRDLNRTAAHRSRTWELYAERIARWLAAAGFLQPTHGGWIWGDKGGISWPVRTRSGRREPTRGPFGAASPPARVVEAAEWLFAEQPQSSESLQIAGFRNAVAVLVQLGLAQSTQREGYSLTVAVDGKGELPAVIREASEHDGTLKLVVEFLERFPSSDGRRVGKYVSDYYSLSWSEASELRNGNALKMWASWLMSPDDSEPPGPRVRHSERSEVQPDLFSDNE